jgi:sulfate permease, SulP family
MKSLAEQVRGLAHGGLKLLPFLANPAWRWPTTGRLRNEIWAGISVGLMLIPQSVAYAQLAGMPVVTGIYAAMWPVLVAVLFGGSASVATGPAALTCLLVGTTLHSLSGLGFSPEFIAIWLALLSGLVQTLLGFARVGWLLNLISSPVLMAFTQAAALLILASQLPALLGFKESGTLAWVIHLAQKPWSAWRGLSVAFGLGGLGFLVLARRYAPRMPAILALVVLAIGLSQLSGFASLGGVVVGSVPEGLPRWSWPGWPSIELLQGLLLPVLLISFVSFLETASSAKAESQKTGRSWNQSQDLIGQGLAKITAGLCGTFPTSASFSRSAVLLYSGASTAWASVFSVLMVLVVLLWCTPWLALLPKAVLAAIVVIAVISLLKPWAFVKLWRVAPVECAIALMTFSTTLLAAPDLYWGVVAGLVLGLSHFLYQRLHPRIIEIGLHPDGSLRDRHLWHLPRLSPHLYALRMDDTLDFASASGLEKAVQEHLAQHPDTRYVCLFAQPINRIDATGVECFAQLQAQLRERGIGLHISGIKLPVETALRRAGLLRPEPLLTLYRADAEALLAIQALS